MLKNIALWTYVCAVCFRGSAGGYPMPSSGLRGPYPPLSSSPLSRFSPGLFPPHPGLPPGFPHHAAGLVSPGSKQDLAAINPDHPHHPSHRYVYVRASCWSATYCCSICCGVMRRHRSCSEKAFLFYSCTISMHQVQVKVHKTRGELFVSICKFL